MSTAPTASPTPNTLDYRAMLNVLRASYDTVTSNIVLAEAYRRGTWIAAQTQQWVATAQRDLIVQDMGTRFASGEYVLLKRKRNGQDPRTSGVGEIQVSAPGTHPSTIFGGLQHYYETVAGGFTDAANPSTSLVTGFNRNGTAVAGGGGRGIALVDNPESAREQLFKKFKLASGGAATGPAGVIPTPGMAVTLPVRLRGVLTSGGELLEELNNNNDRLKWLLSAATVGIGDPSREKNDYTDVVQYALDIVHRPITVSATFCCPWYVTRGQNIVGTLRPVDFTVSKGKLSNGDIVTATVVDSNKVVFAVLAAGVETYDTFATVAFSVGENLFTVTTPVNVVTQWHMYRLSQHGLVCNGTTFTSVDTRCESLVEHRQSVIYTNTAAKLSLIGESETADNGTMVRAWVNDDKVDAVLHQGPGTETTMIVTAKVLAKPDTPHWRAMIESASVGDLQTTTTQMMEYVKTARRADTVITTLPTVAAPYGSTANSGPCYRLIPMKGDGYDFSSGFGQSVHSHHDTFRFSNEPGQWFIGATPSRPLDGLECAVGYLQSQFLSAP